MNESIDELLASGAVVPDRPGSKRLVPAAQSVVVPVEPTAAMLDNAIGTLVVSCPNDRQLARQFWSAMLAAAPALSSLEVGEVDLHALGFWGMEIGRLAEGAKGADEFSAVEWSDLKRVLTQCLAALSPEAPAREGVPRDEHGRTAFEIIADCNRESMMRRAGVKDQSREPLLGPPSDMAVSRILMAERPEIDRHAADLLAIKINDTLAALTPRHEAPVETTAEQEIALSLRHARNRMQSGKVVLADMDAIVDAVNFLEDQARARQMALAEGAGEVADRFEKYLTERAKSRQLDPEDIHGMHIGDAREVVLTVADLQTAIIALRARSSAPEAREGEALRILELIADGWDVIESSGSMGEMTLQAPDDWDGDETETVFKFHTHPAAPSADKLRIAVEAIWEIAGGRATDGHNEAGRLGRIKDRAAEILAALKGGAK